MSDEIRFTNLDETSFELRDESKRELDIRIMPWNTVITHQYGPEMFERGAFQDVDPKKVMLKGPDSWGNHTGPVVGKGMRLEERDDAAYMTFKVSKTTAGDDLLTLVADGVVSGASLAFVEHPDGYAIQQRSGQRVRVQKRVSLDHVVSTWRPAYEHAGVVAMRSQDTPAEEAPVAEPEAAVAAAPDTDSQVMAASVRRDMDAVGTTVHDFAEKFADRITKIEEQQRSSFTIPADKPKLPTDRGTWTSTVLKLLSGERVPEMQMRALDDLISTDNAGVVPDAISNELIGVIDPSRPFMQTTRRLDTPSSGLSLVVPRIVTRPTVGVQSTEKTEITSTATAIDTVSFDAATYAGGGDISLQLLKRSSPSFLSLYLELLAEAYALTTESAAVTAAINAGIGSGGAMDPEALALGSAWSTSIGSSFKRGPDTIWMSSPAVAAFIDAKADGTNAPLYSQLSANFTAGGGVGGSIQGLRAVYVPALDATGIDVLVGPSRGFGWAEDGTFTLQVDVPAKAGRDVALVGILWFATMYPAAFTGYTVSGGGS